MFFLLYFHIFFCNWNLWIFTYFSWKLLNNSVALRTCSGVSRRFVFQGFEWTIIWPFPQVVGLMYVRKDTVSVSETTQTGLTMRMFLILCNGKRRDRVGSREEERLLGNLWASPGFAFLSGLAACWGKAPGTKKGRSLLVFPFGTRKHFPRPIEQFSFTGIR